MTTTVFLVVIAAAILHALWNALLKSGGDKFVGMSAVMMGQAPLAVIAALSFPLPAVESLPYLLAGVALHVGYQIFLTLAYRIGDLSQVYPIARGVAPLIVAGVSIGFLGVALSLPEILGVATIGIGIISLALVRRQDGQRNLGAAGLALVTGCFIAAYSLVDGLGARVSGSPVGFLRLAGLRIDHRVHRVDAALAACHHSHGIGHAQTAWASGRQRLVHRLCAGDLGLHQGADCPGDRLARNQHHIRASDRRVFPEKSVLIWQNWSQPR